MSGASRRAVLGAAAWAAPAVTVAVAVPAYAATSGVPQEECKPVALCKLPGKGQNTKDYAILPNCPATATVVKVRVYDDRNETWIEAAKQDDDSWLARGFNDSRRNRVVEITTTTGVTTHTVAFPPC